MPNTAVRPAPASERIFVVGADGMLGSRLVAVFENQGKDVWGTTRNQAKVGGQRIHLDLADDVEHFAPPFQGCGTAILCAAQTSIAQCQRSPHATQRINVENTVAVARSLAESGMFVIFLSSNAVFDGVTEYARSDDSPNPQNEYGRQKAEAEARLLKLGDGIAVIRFSKIIAPDMALLSGWVRNLRAGEPVHPFSDAVMAPLSAAFATEVICRVETYRRAGVTQASASEDISYADVAAYLAMRIAADMNLVKPVSSKNAGVPTFPDHTTLDTTSLRELGLEAPLPARALDQFI